MKLTESTTTIESSGEMEEQFFSIQDQGMIFDILRNKMYSDPILAICREISCNARDAHREVGKRDQSIEITLPSALEPFYKIKDFGPGISTDRMQNVFIKYTASTKRNDNLQTGGFGLGAKTPFSYSDTFTIITVVHEMKYNYACFIDETKVGKLILMGQEPCAEDNSTQIVIPVKSQDFNKFTVATEECTRHWDVKPTIKNGNLNWKTFSSVIAGDSWKVAVVDEVKNNYNNYNHYNGQYDRGAKVIVDGIEYNISMEALRKFADTKIIDACKGYVFLYFNVGELSLAANRESIYIDKPTEAKIVARLNAVKDEIVNSVNKQIQAYPTYLEANKFFQKELVFMFNNISFLGKLSWNNIQLYGNAFGMNNQVTLFYKGKTLRGKSAGEVKIKSRLTNQVSLDEATQIFFNDTALTAFHFKHVKKAFENTDTTTVQVINPAKTQTFDDLDKHYSLTGVGVQLLSTITVGIPIVNRANYANKLLVFKVHPAVHGLMQVPCADVEADTNKIKVLCLFDRESNYSRTDKRIFLESGKHIYIDALYNMSVAYPNVSFYAVGKETDKERIKKEFVGFISFDQFIKDNIVDSLDECIEIKSLHEMYVHSFVEDDILDALKDKILDKNSLYLDKINLYQEILNKKKSKLKVDVYESLVAKITDKEIKAWVSKNPKVDYNKLADKCYKKYPLLGNHYLRGIKTEDISQYINFIDSI